MNLVFIYGAPATGKLTVAKELSKITGYKLFHNHLTHDLIDSLFDFSTEHAQNLSAELRLRMFEEAVKANLTGIIFTYVYGKVIDDEFIQQVIDTVEDKGGRVMFVFLTADKEQILERVTNESRKEYKKIRDAEALKKFFTQYELFSPIPHRESLIIDNTNIDPITAANSIVKYFHLSED